LQNDCEFALILLITTSVARYWEKIAEEFAVSRMTIRKAIEILIG